MSNASEDSRVYLRQAGNTGALQQWYAGSSLWRDAELVVRYSQNPLIRIIHIGIHKETLMSRNYHTWVATNARSSFFGIKSLPKSIHPKPLTLAISLL